MNRSKIKIEKIQHRNEEIVTQSRRDGEDHDTSGSDRASDENDQEYPEKASRMRIDRQSHRNLLFIRDLSIVDSCLWSIFPFVSLRCCTITRARMIRFSGLLTESTI